MFGSLFPLGFFLMYVSNIFELINDKNVFFYLLRRPSPIGMAKIGFWIIMFLVVSIFGVLSNGYILAILYSEWYLTLESDKLALLIAFIVFGFLVWSMIGFFKGSGKYFNIIRNRTFFIKRRILNNKRTK